QVHPAGDPREIRRTGEVCQGRRRRAHPARQLRRRPREAARAALRGGVVMLDIVIRGGEVVTPDGVVVADVAIQGETIAAVAAPGTLGDDVGRVVDATGKLVIPGGIDPHVHTGWPIPSLDGGLLHSAGAAQVSRAAIFGGTTTLVDFAVWAPNMTLQKAIEAK